MDKVIVIRIECTAPDGILGDDTDSESMKEWEHTFPLPCEGSGSQQPIAINAFGQKLTWSSTMNDQERANDNEDILIDEPLKSQPIHRFKLGLINKAALLAWLDFEITECTRMADENIASGDPFKVALATLSMGQIIAYNTIKTKLSEVNPESNHE